MNGGDDMASSTRSRLLRATFVAGSVAWTISAAQAVETFDIGIIDSLTGTVAVAGNANVCGAKVAEAAINASGGVVGRQIKLHVADNQSNPAFAAQAASKLTDEDVKFFVGGATSATVLSMLPIIADVNGLYTGGSTKADEILHSKAMVVRLNSDNSQDGASIAKYVSETLKARKISYVSVQGAYGEGALVSIKKALPADIQIVNTYFAPAETTNFQSILTSVRADNSDAVIFAIAGSSQPVAFIRQYKQAGLDAPAIAGTGVLTQTVAQAASGSADGVASADLWMAEIDKPANNKLKADYEQYGKSIAECGNKPLDKQGAITYSQVALLAQGAAKAKSFDPKAIYKVLKEGTWDLPQGEVKFRDDGQALVTYYPIVGKNGTVLPLIP
jgi:branched-chain amino acid transport system substrate-binding protein